MSPKEIAKYKENLQTFLARLDRSRIELRDESMHGTGGEAGGGISNVPLHPADLGNRATEEETSLRLLENEEQLIEEINLALERIEAGNYGKCEGCGQTIAKQRLHAVPYARRCIRCARGREAGPES